MATAALMLAHQVAGKAFRDAAFLSTWPATALPAMTMATALIVVLLVPLFSRLLDRLDPPTVVAAGFLLSAVAHGAEWLLFDAGRWVVVVIYLHLAAASGLLLSGFWSLVDERFDPASARGSFGRIAAAGTAGGVLGSVVSERTASMLQPVTVLMLLAALHVLCGIGVLWIGQTPGLLSRRDSDTRAGTTSGVRTVLSTPYLRVIAGIVVCTTAASAILDYMLKSEAAHALGTGPQLLRFFTAFYAVVQVLSFLAQTSMHAAMGRLGISGTISALPAAVGTAGLAAMLTGSWPMVVLLRGIDAVLRGSLFRSGYELLFVPMDPGDRRRVKTVVDVTCDRAGEAAGAGIVQVLISGVALVGGSLLAIVVMLAAAAYWLARRLERLYVGVVEQELLKRRDAPPIALVSEAGWTMLKLEGLPLGRNAEVTAPAASGSALRPPAPELELMAELKSGSTTAVERALTRASRFERMHVAAAIDLLAWDDVVPRVREALEQAAPAHLGMMIDALLDPNTDFAIRRRLPRILGTVPHERSLDGLVRALGDARFEVRYHCSRAIDRILVKNPELTVDRAHMLAVVQQELSVSAQVWQGYRLLDRPETDDREGILREAQPVGQRNVEHVFSLLATVIPREPLDAAFRALIAPDVGVRGLALEYLEQVLPAGVLAKLQVLIEVSRRAAPPPTDAVRLSSGDAPGRSDSPPRATEP